MAHLSEKALLVELLELLRNRGSWCGETHLQKSVYVAQEVLGVPFKFNFVLYKHGPFSFDLRDELVEAQAESFLRQEVRPYPYGPTLVRGDRADTLLGGFPKTIAKYRAELEFVANQLGEKRAGELEGLITAIHVSLRDPEAKPQERAKVLRAIKPHIDSQEALAFVEDADELLNAAERLRNE